MASAMRQRLQGLLPPLGSRYGRQASALATRGFAHSATDDLDEAHKWRNVTGIGLAAVIAYGIYVFTGEQEHGHHERPGYPYLHIRNKEFPWGPDGLFEHKHE